MKAKLFDYVERHNVVYDLSGVTKLFCFLLLTAAVMFSYDIRAIAVIMALSLVFFPAPPLPLPYSLTYQPPPFSTKELLEMILLALPPQTGQGMSRSS